VDQRIISFKYLTDFHCIADQCEDHCCGHWKIFYDPPSLQILKNKVGDAGLSEIVSFETIGDRTVVQLKLNKQQNCTMLDDNGLCSIHSLYGEEALANTCASFPRRINYGADVELTASLACPEIARKCLQNSDAVDFVFGDDLVNEKKLQVFDNRYDATTSDPYLSNNNDIRNLMYELLNLEGFSIAQKFFIVSSFASDVSKFYFRDSPNYSEQQLVESVNRITDFDYVKKLVEEFDELDVKPHTAIELVQLVLNARIVSGTEYYSVLNELIAEIAGLLKSDARTGNDNNDLFVNIYQEIKHQISLKHEQRIEQYFTNYARNAIISEWYVSDDNLMKYLQLMSVRIILLKFLLFCHPKLLKRYNEGLTLKGVTEDELDAIAVDVFYKFTRGIEHDKVFFQSIQKAVLNKPELLSLAFLTYLLKF